MSADKHTCAYCERTSEEVPIVAIQFRGKEYGICSQHLPVIIHKPEQLASNIPGIEKIGPAEGHDH